MSEQSKSQTGNTQNRVTRQAITNKDLTTHGPDPNVEFINSPLNKGPKKETSSSTTLLGNILQEFRTFNVKFDSECQSTATRHEQLVSKLDELVVALSSKTTPTTDRGHIVTETDISRFIAIHEQTWKENLNKRRKAFFLHMRNTEKAIIYENYLKLEPVFIANICKEKTIVGQNSPEWLQIKTKREISNMEHEIVKMQTLSKQNEEIVKNVDQETMTLFNNLPEHTLENIRLTWTTQTSMEEDKSKKEWQQKKEYLEKLPTKTPNKKGDDQDPNERTSKKKPAPWNSNSNQVRDRDSAFRQTPMFSRKNNNTPGTNNNKSRNNPHFKQASYNSSTHANKSDSNSEFQFPIRPVQPKRNNYQKQYFQKVRGRNHSS